MGTLNRHSKTQSQNPKQFIYFSRVIMNQFALVQMKVTAGAIERPKQDNPQKGNGLACGDIKQLLSPYPS